MTTLTTSDSTTPETGDNPTENSPPNLRDTIERMFQIRQERKNLSERDSQLVEEFRGLEAQVLQELRKNGGDKISFKGLGTAILSENILPNVTDWDAFYEYIQDTGSLHLLQRRVATAAYRELQETGQEIPGVETYTQAAINLRTS